MITLTQIKNAFKVSSKWWHALTSYLRTEGNARRYALGKGAVVGLARINIPDR